MKQVTSCYHLPCTLHTPEKIVLLTDSLVCEQELTKIFNQLQQENTQDIKVTKASYSVVNDNIILANIDWAFTDEQGQIFADFCAIYHLVLIADQLKIINVVSHDLSNSLSLDYPLVFDKT